MNNGNDNSLASGPGPSRRAVLSGGAAVLAAIGAGALVPGTAHAAPRIPAAGSAAVTGASASVSANGTYTVTTPSPAFTFTGTVGAAATNISASTAGSDAVGAYHEIDFQVHRRRVRAHRQHPDLRLVAGRAVRHDVRE